MRYEKAVEVEAAANQVWEVLNDVVRWSDWSPTIEEVNRLDGGAFTTGSTARVKQPKMRPLTWTVTEDDPGHSFVWATRTSGCTLTAGHYLSEADGRVGVRLTFQIAGTLAPLLSALAGGRIRRYVDLEGENLKRHCESRHSDAG
jgi:carbon monoxide dehydrogenase subunit G